ncbi:MAG: hypothetical protein AAGK14_08230 [Verrucomicrobiota bacterium]
MSIKYIHLIIIAISWLMCFGVGAWCLLAPQAAVQAGESVTWLGVLCLVGGVALLIYNFYVWRKLRKIHVG